MDLILLIGVPGSGKSTYARRLHKSTISLDGIRKQLYGDARILGKSSEVDRQMRHRLVELAGKGRDVVLDATHVSPLRRGRTIRLGRKLGYDRITAIWFDPPLSVSLERNRRRKRRVPEFVIRKFHRDLNRQPPSLAEGFDDLQIVRS